MDESQQLAGTLDSISSCSCKAKFIPSIPDCYEKETVSSSGRSGVVTAAPTPAALMTKRRSEPEPEQHAQVWNNGYIFVFTNQESKAHQS